jgi:cephalosporin hydroxylase
MINKIKRGLLRLVRPVTRRCFEADLIHKTGNFGNTKWLGNPIWQNVLDLWVIQETISEVKPELLIECGTNRGGSSLFYAHLLDLTESSGSVITIDVEKLHNLSHPRITYLLGSSTDPKIVSQVRERVAACKGPVLVILDSDHSASHVAAELVAYTPFVTHGSYCMVQDGVIDTFGDFKAGRPGPLAALKAFMKPGNGFVIDEERSSRFLITHHPQGWLKRV